MMPHSQPYGPQTDEKRLPIPLAVFVASSHGDLEHALEQIARQNLESVEAGYIAPFRIEGDGVVMVTASYMQVLERRHRRRFGQ